MKAVVFFQKGKVETVQMETPELSDTEVLIEVMAAGVSSTDRKIVQGKAEAEPEIILGHEVAGIIRDAGELVPDAFVGEPVVVDPNVVCNICPECHLGKPHLCRYLRTYGVHFDGGFAEYFAVNMTAVYFFDDEILPFEIAAFAEPLSRCIHALDRANMRPGQSAVVIGTGPEGLMMAQLLLLSGAGFVAVTGRNKERMEMAEEMGIAALNRSELRAFEERLDVVFETSGTSAAATLAIRCAAPGGRVVFLGEPAIGDALRVSLYEVHDKELTLLGSLRSPFTIPRALDVLQSEIIQPELLISHRLSLDELPSFLMHAPPQGEIKPMVFPGS